MELLGYFLDALTPLNLALALVGVVLGTVIGALPGLSATMAVAVLVPFTFSMDPASGLIALGAIYTGAIYGGAFAAILVNTPGTPSSIATTFDGYPMARRGDGGLAVTLATLASVCGGIVGALALLFLAPPLARVALAFGPPEYFWLAIFGLTLIAALSVGNTLKGLIGACLGLLLSMVGVAVVGGDVRLTGGLPAFLGGIDVVSALIGLYCVPVILDLVATRAAHLKVELDDRGYRLREAFGIAWASKFNVARSSVIGTVVGILPGAGGSIAGLVSYTEARRASTRSANFGKGEPDGVIATEAANNATVGGGFIPTLVLGIPGTPPDAIILGALLVQGIKIGPQLFTSEANIVYTFIYGLLIATILMLPAGLLIGRYAYRSIIAFPKSLLVPTIAFLTVVGSFAINSNVLDVQMMFVLGIVGWVLNRYGFQPSPIVLGLVLGQIAEQGFVQTYLIGNATGNLLGMYFGRPISIGIILAALLSLGYPFYAEWRMKKKPRQPLTEIAMQAESHPVRTDRAPQDGPRTTDRGALIAGAAFVALGAVALANTTGLSPMGSVFPRAISILLILLSAGLMVLSVTGRGVRASPPEAAETSRRRLLLGAVFGLWVFVMPYLGFAVTGLAAFLGMMVIAEHDSTSRLVWLRRVLIALGVVGLFWLLMARVLLLRMPAGLYF
ncbi:MAG: tripartite tricarboxylate transporter permease [Paracoccus sp. (in: a-proteobacteria)]|uniref:tripartite tricarboxylate transporter permease n=3 Tax=Paracoccus TaxID=265 RepID=UPI000C628C2D|nr:MULTISPECIES: tripartite tricarboxylate transporter permease [unclassified Paracoccus (in: a-proteobacteria)]MAN56778.1 C4-dicarboxylate ABC transporter permease [Paracoccus sp. (in: a-proteobacteria)]MBA48195.1 C4-dicarboxylate ABC transporter permease [Paracoccus sp. (in: a-proteobacteria)]MCS5601126.1 tripartite tricarboxylate transporter permease [Paracoccus sp. (in: a-proteobacteria)]MDB2552009.1 tripartite tricarboxylate transporter permease [Paracoccus sp. (in: a-proteobacteria)]|tara:strand:- start:1341 stop:3362 length:2022 start_codon:yes stop_codon:yes gene_type:complete